MATIISIWSLEVPAGKTVKFHAVGDIRITNASLGAELAEKTARSVVKLTYEMPAAIDDDIEDMDEIPEPETASTFLCALTPGLIEQATLDITMTEEDDFVFENIGKNTVFLTGNYIDQHQDEEPYGYGHGSDSEDDDSEEDYDLREVSSDVEMNPADIELGDSDEDDAPRFEEIADEPQKSKKRTREETTTDEAEGGKKLSKKDKKAAKKQKGEEGQAVPTSDAATPKADEKQKETNGEAKTKKEGKTKKEKKGDSAGMKSLPSGLKFEDKSKGTGKVAKRDDKVSMRYIGKLESGKVFDKNTSGKPFAFRLGKGEVIKGWDEGIAGMQPGGERLLIVPASLAYGKQKLPGIPPNSTLHFECKLLEIQ